MKVAFHARALSEPNLRGIGRYMLNLIPRLRHHGIAPVLCSNQPIHPIHRSVLQGCEEAIGGYRSPLLWDQTWERLAARHGADLLHAPGNYGLPVCSRRPAVLTLHDAIDYSFYKDRLRRGDRWSKAELVGRWMHWSARIGANRVITVSEYSRRDIHRRLRVPSREIVVTYEAADADFTPAGEAAILEMRQRRGLSEPFVFYIGGWETRKNVEFLLDAFAAAKVPGLRLVMGGGSSGEELALKARAERLGITDCVLWLGRIDDAELRAFYSSALVFVYPSRSEGFGLQLCEAMACHCPILAADATCLPEILGKGGEVFPLGDPAVLAAMIRRLASDDDYRHDLVQRSKARGAFFSWDDCAARTAEVYRSLLTRKIDD